MKIHEYQAKQILARYNVRIPRGEVAYTKEEARDAAHRIGGTCLLYTSPSPRDRQKSRMPSSA